MKSEKHQALLMQVQWMHVGPRKEIVQHIKLTVQVTDSQAKLQVLEG